MKLSESKSDTSIISHIYKSINNNYRRLSNNSSLLHRIPTEIDIPRMEIGDEYDIQKTIAEGCYAKILLAHHRPTNTTIVLKAIHTELTSLKEFIKEFHYNYQLSHHPNILSCYQVKFQTNDYYVFAQEHAPFGDLASNVGPIGIPESCCKKMSEQLSGALGFMHLKGLVHRDLKLENILVFNADFSRIKLCDFGATTRENLLVSKNTNTWISFLPPEILELQKNERFTCKSSCDVWQFGVILYLCLTGSSPWNSADWVTDSKYCAFMKYQKRETTKIPDNFRKFSPRLLRAFRRIFDHNEEDRAKVTDIMKYVKNKWLDTKISTSKSASNIIGLSGYAQYLQQTSDQDSIKYINHKESRHSIDGKTRVKRMMSTFGMHSEQYSAIEQESGQHRVMQWLHENEINFKLYDHCDDFTDLTFWQKNEKHHQQYSEVPAAGGHK